MDHGLKDQNSETRHFLSANESNQVENLVDMEFEQHIEAENHDSAIQLEEASGHPFVTKVIDLGLGEKS